MSCLFDILLILLDLKSFSFTVVYVLVDVTLVVSVYSQSLS